ncbi:hypothetical protein NKT34_30045, partial [Paenibacillus polysaccharolyticus]|uniref:hypothetical protein n=1 Tax=Paenibacillus polysaccharolyticus TaxID=582692 RepID=UPI00209CB2E0
PGGGGAKPEARPAGHLVGFCPGYHAEGKREKNVFHQKEPAAAGSLLPSVIQLTDPWHDDGAQRNHGAALPAWRLDEERSSAERS